MAEQPSVPGVSSRRSACDKCRFSKSRCLRSHPNQSKCDRCTRAERECTTSPIFRVRDWRPGGASGYISSQNTSKDGSREHRRGSATRIPPGTTIVTASTIIDSGVDPEFYSGGGVSSGPGSDQYSQSATTSSDPLGISHEETGAYAEGAFDLADGNMNMEDNHVEFTPPDDFFTTMPVFESDTGIAQPLPLIGSSGMDVGGGILNAFPDDSNSQYRKLYTAHGPSNTDTCFDTEPALVQQLPQLDYELTTLRAKLEQAVPEAMMHVLFQGTEKGDASWSSVITDILEKTTRFVDILGRLSKSCIPEIVPSSRASTRSPHHHSRRRRRRGSSTSLGLSSADDSDAAISPSQGNSEPQFTTSSNSEHAHVELDTPALLLILASYSRILGICLIVFSHLYKYLKTISESENPHLRPISGLSVSNYSARKQSQLSPLERVRH